MNTEGLTTKLLISKSKNSVSLYVAKSIWRNGKSTSEIVEKLGTIDALRTKLNGQDPIQWAKEYIAELNKKEKEGKQDIIVKLSPAKIISKDEKHVFSAGYLFLQKIYYELGLHKICKKISENYKFAFDLNSVLSRLVYARIISPSSKSKTMDEAEKFLEQPDFELQHIYRGLEVLAKESDFIQSQLYKNSKNVFKRNTNILYYDCTNFYFEIDQEKDDKQYGASKEHQPKPIVQMGLFMDGSGIPLAMNINPGNTNEQTTLRPLEKKILKDFELSRFIVCTDAGLASQKNREFNTKGERAFITTQSIKQLKGHLKEWALDYKGWSLPGKDEKYDLTEIEKEPDKYEDAIFYKERWINENNLEQRLIVTFCLKYRNYQRYIRNSQVERVKKTIESNPTKIKKSHPYDYKRFIKRNAYTTDGEIAENVQYVINENLIAQEEKYDGFYAVCTVLEDDATEITKIMKNSWEIEECFRIMKTDFKARPVYLSRRDRIIAHFITCFISLIIYRFLEKKLGEKYTCSEILSGLRSMAFKEIKGKGYMPIYTRTDFTDDLHGTFGFRTDYEIVTYKQMKKIFKMTKTP